MSKQEEEQTVKPSIWPFTAAGGVALLLFGVVTTYAFSLAGGCLLAIGLAGWIGDLRDG